MQIQMQDEYCTGRTFCKEGSNCKILFRNWPFKIRLFHYSDEVLRKWVISSSHSAALLVPTAFLPGRPAWFLRQELDQVLSQWLIWVGTRTSSIHWGDFNPFEIQIKWNFKLRLSLGWDDHLTDLLAFRDLSALNFIFGSDPLYCQTT